jgi:serine/threonine-protein kinase
MISRMFKIFGLFFLFALVGGAGTYFTLSMLIKSEDTVVVPDLAAKDIVNVLELLSDLGLNTKVKGSEYSPEIPKNHVIYQDPEPGAEIKQGRDVRIILSKGTRSIVMPNLKGLSVQQGRIILEENDLCLGKISSTYSPNLKKDDIIAQMPAAGAMVSRGDCSNLLLSLGIRPRAYKMPNLNGLPLDEALLVLEKNHLTLGKVDAVFHEHEPIDTILEQEPSYGYRVLEHSAVNLTLNRKPGQNTQQHIQMAGGVALFRYRLADGWLKKRVRLVLNSYGFAFEMLDGLMKPGTEIWLLIPNNMDATLSLYEDDKLVKVKVYDAQ